MHPPKGTPSLPQVILQQKCENRLANTLPLGHKQGLNFQQG